MQLHYLLINGVVVKIDETVSHEKYILLANNVQCFFTIRSEWYIETLSYGSSVIIRGKVYDYIQEGNNSVIRIGDCEQSPKSDYNNLEVENWSDIKIFLGNLLTKTESELGLKTKCDNSNSNVYLWAGTYKYENGTLIITNEDEKGFDYKLEVAFQSGIGDISGKAKIKSMNLAVHYLNEYGQKGQIKFSRNRNRITIDESGCAANHHGAGAEFSGNYYSDNISIRENINFTQENKTEKLQGSTEITEIDKSNIKQMVSTYFQNIQDKQLNNAINCFISSKRTKVKPIIVKIISETDYYKNMSITNMNLLGDKIIAKVIIDQKRYVDPDIEHWGITFEVMQSGGTWKIYKVY